MKEILFCVGEGYPRKKRFTLDWGGKYPSGELMYH